jgi:MFS family permease
MVVLGLVTFVDSADGSIMRGVLTPVERNFHIADFQASLLFAAPILVNALVTVPAGFFADRWRRVRAIGLTLVAWSAVCCLSALSPVYAALLAARTLTGFGQGVNEPSANSALADYYPINRRATAFSVQQCLNYLGVAFGTATAGLVASRFGWRAAYLVVPIPGFLVAAAVFLLLREPRRSQSDLEHLGIEAGPLKDETFSFAESFRRILSGLRSDFGVILRIPTLRMSLVGVAFVLFTVSAIGTWLPTFYERSYHMSARSATALFGLVIAGAGIPGTLAGGRISDWLVGRVRGGRVVIPAASAFVATTLFLISFAPLPLGVTVALQVLGFFTGTLAVPALRAGISDVTPGQVRGTGFGAFNLTAVVFGSALAPVIVGAVSQAFGNDLRLAFAASLPPVYLAAWLFWRARRLIEADTQALFDMLMKQFKESQEG